MAQAQNYVSVAYFCLRQDHQCTILHESTKVLKVLDDLNTVDTDNGNVRMALCLCVEDYAKIIEEVRVLWPQIILFVLCGKHPGAVDGLHESMIISDIDLCSNGEWESAVHTALSDRLKTEGHSTQQEREWKIAQEIKKRRNGEPMNSIEESNTSLSQSTSGNFISHEDS